MHHFYFFCKNCAGIFFAYASHRPPPPLKNKMVRPYHEAETRQCYLSHTVSAFAFSIISYRHAARQVLCSSNFMVIPFLKRLQTFLKPHSDW